MNIQTATEARQHAKTIREKLMGSKPVSKNLAVEERLRNEISNLRRQLLGMTMVVAEYERAAIEAEAKKDEIAEEVKDKSAQIEALRIEADLPAVQREAARLIVRRELESYPGISIEMVTGRLRTRRVIEAKHHCIYQIHLQRPDMSLPQIGRVFGGMDHSSILHVLRKMKKLDGKGGAI